MEDISHANNLKKICLLKFFLPTILLLLVIGCNSSGSTSISLLDGDDISLSNVVKGGAVTGPIANAKISIYAFDSSYSNFQSRKPIAITYTKSTSGFSDLEVTADSSPPYIMEMTIVENTINLNTNLPPVITKMKSIITQEMIDTDLKIFATPHTTVALNIAITNTLSNKTPYTGESFGDTTKTIDRFLAALPIAAEQVTGTLGFGLVKDVNIFNTPPQIESDTVTKEALADSTNYRAAIAALTSLVEAINKQSGSLNNDAALSIISLDLSDGIIDGTVYGQDIPEITESILNLFSQDPESFIIPNTDIKVSEIETIIKSEIANTGEILNDGLDVNNVVTLPPELDSDIDDDGILNSKDDFPTDASADTDSDDDGLPNIVYILDENGKRTSNIDSLKSDPDDDNDGVIDSVDLFPLNILEWIDTDGDGIGNNTDPDDDGDGTLDSEDSQPLDATITNVDDPDNDGWPLGQDPDQSDPNIPLISFIDTDKDGLANDGGLNPDSDDDNDGVSDQNDIFPLDKNEQLDLDNDGVGDNSDIDIDGDDVINELDSFPRDPLEYIDTDLDGIGNNSDPDDDNDKLADIIEIQLGTNPLIKDSDGDGLFDNADTFPIDPAEQSDNDQDGIGDNSDLDDDNDGTNDIIDAFPLDSTESVDTDKDGIGNNTDTDDDGDGVTDGTDPFPLDSSEWIDTDNDGTGNNSDSDDDNDGVNDANDAFPLDSTESLDTDVDGIGNKKDSDDDNDGVPDFYDMFPLDGTEWVDDDEDGIGNNADPDDDPTSVADHLDDVLP